MVAAAPDIPLDRLMERNGDGAEVRLCVAIVSFIHFRICFVI